MFKSVTFDLIKPYIAESLILWYQSASKDKSVKVIVIAANGNVFSAGHNLKDITEARSNDDYGDAYFNKLFDTCPKS